MKRYVWIAATLAAITGVNASENPFELTENLKKLEAEQQILLKDLKKEAATLEAIQEAKDDADIDAEDDETVEAQPTKSVVPEEVVPVQPQKEKRMTSEISEGNAEDEAHMVPVQKAPESAPQEVVKIDKIKADQAKIDAEREAQAKAEAKKREAEMKAKQEREALAKLKAEREAAQKREKEAELARLKAEKERLEKQVAEKTATSKVSEAIADSDDINITREELEAKRKADEELKKAIAEVDQED